MRKKLKDANADMKYTIEAQTQLDEPTWVIRIVDDVGKQLHAGTLVIEGSTKESLEEKIKQTCLEYEEVLKEKAEQEAKRRSVETLIAAVFSFFQGTKEVTEKELASYKEDLVKIEAAKLQAIEDERIAKEEAEAAALKAKEEVVEPPVEEKVLPVE